MLPVLLRFFQPLSGFISTIGLKTLSNILIPSALTFYAASIYYNGQINQLKLEIEVARAGQVTQTLIAERELSTITRKIEQKLNTEKEQLLKERYELKKQIEQYRSDTDRLSDEWVRLHDKSTPMPRDTTTPGGTNEANTELQNAKQALSVVTENYAQCQEAVNRLRGWQQWYNEINRK